MVEINKNTKIVEEKKAPAKKAPAKKADTPEAVEMLLKTKYAVEGRPVTEEEIKKEAQERLTPIQEQEAHLDAEAMAEEHLVNLEKALIHVENMAIEHQGRIDKVVDNTKILSTNLKEYTKRLDSMHEKSDKLSDKLTFVNDANVTIMFPNHLIESIINEQIAKVNNQLMDSIKEAEDSIEELLSDDIKEALKQVSRINDLKNRICDLEDKGSILDDLDYEIETAVQNELDYKDLVSPDDVHDIVIDRIDETDFVSEERFTEDIAELQRQVKGLMHIIDNKDRRSLINRFVRFVNKYADKYVKWFERVFKTRKANQ